MNTIEYYSRRAATYEEIYGKPERQDDLARLRHTIGRILSDHDVLEIACGTGYWTRVIGPSARTVVATDPSATSLRIAQGKQNTQDSVRFQTAKVEDIEAVEGDFTALLGADSPDQRGIARIPFVTLAGTSAVEPGSKISP